MPLPACSPVPPETDRVLIAVNPTAGRTSSGDKADRLASLLTARGFQVELVPDLGELAAKANHGHQEGRLRAVVGVGGDGTAAELANRTLPGVPITMLPAGTANLLARFLHMGRSPEEVCETVCSGRLLRMDAGRAGERVFLLMVTCGFDADVVQRLHDRRTGHIRRTSYARPILESVCRYNFPEVRVYWEDEDARTAPEDGLLSAGWVFVFNLPCYGGGPCVTPKADGTDGLLDFCALRSRSFWRGLWFAGSAVLGRQERLRDCVARRIRRIRLTSDEPVPYQIDGDPGGTLPLEVEVLPGRVAVVVPGHQPLKEASHAQ